MCSYLRSDRRGLLSRAEQLRRLCALRLPDLLVVQEPNRGTAPYYPVPVVLQRNVSITFTPPPRETRSRSKPKRTSFFVTGLSISTSCVSRGNFPSASRSDSSDRLLDASTRFVRFGIEVGRVGWMAATRLRASSRVRIRGDSGKFPRTWMSLSVKSIESWGCG